MLGKAKGASKSHKKEGERMNNCIQDCISCIELGTPQTFRAGGITVIPILMENNGGIDYLTLHQALEMDFISIAEVSETGDVNKLTVTNRGDKPVLILDGEQLVGARQDRVTNTTILVESHSKTIIDVSCTEHNRWYYTAGGYGFTDSDFMMSHEIKKKKTSSVSESLHHDRGFRSDQQEIWNDISSMNQRSDSYSPTGAMKDSFETHRITLDEYVATFPLVSKQHGLVVLINGRVEGLEMVSQEAAYGFFHEKIIRSYAIDALQEADHGIKPPLSTARKFVKKIPHCHEENFASVGIGKDFRFKSQSIIGSALVVDGTPVWFAFHSMDGVKQQYRGRGAAEQVHRVI